MGLRRLHTWEFKEDVVARANEEGADVPALARELGLNSTMVRRWQKEKAAGRWEGHPSGAIMHMPPRKYNKTPKQEHTPSTPSASSASSEQVKKLQQKIDFLTKENDILKQMVTLYLNPQT